LVYFFQKQYKVEHIQALEWLSSATFTEKEINKKICNGHTNSKKSSK